MKKIITISILGFIICTAFNMPTAFTDYRDSYTGSYFCNRSCEGMRNRQNTQSTQSDTVTIIVTKDALDSILKITIGKNTMQAKIKNKMLNPHSESSAHWGGKFFATDSISFMSSRLGSTCRYAGKKK
ncbi:MAG TPA: hypothetical protein VF411_11950 [Bacteroidia bacterium]